VPLSISEFIGHFHPVLVHLPVGILLLGVLLQWLSFTEKYKNLRPAVSIVFFCGMITAVCSCVTGYILSVNEEYDKTMVERHQWFAIALALVSILVYLKTRLPGRWISEKILSLLLLVLIFATGHLGGSITHGSDYLTKPFEGIFTRDSLTDMEIKPIPDVQQAYVYADIIKPIFQNKCYSCHGPNRQKGKLRLDDSLHLLQGGKDGKVIYPGNANESQLIKRLLLPVDNEDHMPPKEKVQPSESQIALLEWWINQGANFQKKVNEFNQTASIHKVLVSLQETKGTENKFTDVPEESVEKADGFIIEKMKNRGLIVLPVSQNSNWLQVNFLTDTVVDEEVLRWLIVLKKQLVILKLGNTNFNDSDMSVVPQFKNLRFLNLEHTKITDIGLRAIRMNQHLQYLNLVGTKVSLNGVLQLKELTSLQTVYLFQTDITQADWIKLHLNFPKTRIDTGGYSVPLLTTDTMVVKAKKEN
jgi:uncharacterized membrane protein